MQEIQATIRRNGAFQCGLDESLDEPGLFHLEYLVSTWAEYLRQSMRMTVEETRVFNKAWDLHSGNSNPIVRCFLSTQRLMHLPGFGFSGRTFADTSSLSGPSLVATSDEAPGVFSQSFRIVRPHCGVPPERLPPASGAGFGAQSPHQIGSGHDRKSFVGLTGFPEREQEHGELSGHSDYGPFLDLDGAILGKPSAIIAQSTFGPKRPQDVLRGAHQEATQIAVSALADTQLLVGFFALISPGTQTHEGANVSCALEAFRVFDLQHEVKRGDWSYPADLLKVDGLRILLGGRPSNGDLKRFVTRRELGNRSHPWGYQCSDTT